MPDDITGTGVEVFIGHHVSGDIHVKIKVGRQKLKMTFTADQFREFVVPFADMLAVIELLDAMPPDATFTSTEKH